MARIAFFGPGLMGEPMAERLCGAKHSVTVVAHRNRGPIERLVAVGAVEASSPAAAALGTDVAIMMLPTAREVEDVLFGHLGLTDHMASGYTVIDMGSNFPPDTIRIAKRIMDKGGHFLDAPVTGGRVGARNGTLTIMVGGDLDTLEHARPLFEAMGKDIYHFGDVGAGHTAKLIKSMMTITWSGAIAEAFVLAAAAKLDLGKLFAMLRSLPTTGPMLLTVMPKVFAREFDHVDGRLDIAYKDIKQATALAREMTVPLPIANGATELIQLSRALGFGNLDSTALIRGLEAVLGLEVRAGESRPEAEKL